MIFEFMYLSTNEVQAVQPTGHATGKCVAGTNKSSHAGVFIPIKGVVRCLACESGLGVLSYKCLQDASNEHLGKNSSLKL